MTPLETHILPRTAAALDRLSAGLDRLMRVAAGIFLLAMVATIGLQVVARYVFSSPPPWTEEVARYAMVWVGLLGATISFKAGFDPTLFRMTEKVPGWLRAVATPIRGLAVLIFLAPILWYSFFGPNMNPARGFLTRHSNLKAETFDLSTIFVAVGVPLFVVVIFIHGLAALAVASSDAHRKEA